MTDESQDTAVPETDVKRAVEFKYLNTQDQREIVLQRLARLESEIFGLMVLATANGGHTDAPTGPNRTIDSDIEQLQTAVAQVESRFKSLLE